MKMTDDDIKQIVLGEISAARSHIDSNVMTKRMERWDRYYGRKLGNEKKGQSTWRSRDVMDTVEWMLPYLVRTFTTGESPIKITIDGQPDWVGAALRDQILKDMDVNEERSAFLNTYEWIKDSLVSATAGSKISWARDFERKTESFEMLTREQGMQIEQDPNLKIVAGTPSVDPYSNNPILLDAKIEIKKIIRDDLRVDSIPHWEFLYAPKSTSINDEHGKGQQTEVSLDYLRRTDRAMRENGKPFFENLDELTLDGDGKTPSPFVPTTDGTESTERETYKGHATPIGVDEKGSRRRIKLCEWYTRIDVNNDGYSEDIVVWMGDNTLLRWQPNNDGMIPISVISPILDCFKMEGISYADLLIEVQNLKTMLIRRILDNYAYSNQGRWVVMPGTGFDVQTLLQNTPGDVIDGDPNAIKDLSPKPFHPGVLNLVTYADSIKEDRTGMTRFNQGSEQPKTNAPASGIGMIQSAAHQRLEMVARIFAETGMKDQLVKAARLYQRYRSTPFTAKVNGVKQEVTPEMIQGKIFARVDMGAEAQIGIIQSQQIERMFGFLARVNQDFPGILRPETVYKFASHYISAFGRKDASELIGSMEDYIKTVKANMEARQKSSQAGYDMAKGDQKIKADKVQADFASSQAENQNKKEIAKIHASVKQLTSMQGDGMKRVIAELQATTTAMTKQGEARSREDIASLQAQVDLLIASQKELTSGKNPGIDQQET